MTVFEKVKVAVSVKDYKVAYASFQAGRRPAKKLLKFILEIISQINFGGKQI